MSDETRLVALEESGQSLVSAAVLANRYLGQHGPVADAIASHGLITLEYVSSEQGHTDLEEFIN